MGMDSIARGAAIFVSVFCLINAIGGFFRNTYDGTLWLLDLRNISPALARFLVLALGVVLLLACVLWQRRPMRFAAAAALIPAIAAGALNAIGFYRLLWSGTIRSDSPVALSLITALALAAIAARLSRPASPRSRPALAIAAFAVSAAAFPLLQIYCFGKTDYRREADMIVVLGARVYADGRCSDALADRVRTGTALYHQGIAPRLLMTGGPGDGAVHETAAMKQLAISLGVPEEAILVDAGGVNTDASVRNTMPILDRLQARRVLAVSHFYHLPRIKLAYARAGQEVYTVPAKESYTLRKMPLLIAREVAALWVYYLRG